MSAQRDSLEPIYTHFFEDGATCTIYKDCIKFETGGKVVIREPRTWHSLAWNDGGAPDALTQYVPSIAVDALQEIAYQCEPDSRAEEIARAALVKLGISPRTR